MIMYSEALKILSLKKEAGPQWTRLLIHKLWKQLLSFFFLIHYFLIIHLFIFLKLCLYYGFVNL